MPVMRTYCCPECEQNFDFLHSTWDEPPPAHCSLCGAFVGEVEPELPRVNIGGSAISKSVDQVFAQSGQSNLQDGLREGDIAAPKINNIITQYAEAAGMNMWQGSGGGEVSQYVADAKSGPAGVNVIDAMQSFHKRRI